MKTKKRILAGILSALFVLVANVGVIPAFATSEDSGTSYPTITWQRSLEKPETLAEYSADNVGGWDYNQEKTMPLTNPIIWDGGLVGTPAIPGSPAVEYQPAVPAVPAVEEVLAKWQREVITHETLENQGQTPEGEGWTKLSDYQAQVLAKWEKTTVETKSIDGTNNPGDGWVLVTPYQAEVLAKWQKFELKTGDKPHGDGWVLIEDHRGDSHDVWKRLTGQYKENKGNEPDEHGNWEKVRDYQAEVLAVWQKTTVETIENTGENPGANWVKVRDYKAEVKAVWQKEIKTLETIENKGATPEGEGWTLVREYVAPVAAVEGKPEVLAKPAVDPVPAVQGQYFTGYSTRNDITWASWENVGSKVNVRLFKGTFNIPSNVNIVSAHLGTMNSNEHFTPIIPINDNLYVYINGLNERRIMGGTSYGGSRTESNEFVHSDYWTMDTSEINLASFLNNGINTLEVFTEEYNNGGGMGELVLQIQTTPKDTTAPVIAPVNNANVTIAAASGWTAPLTTASDAEDGVITSKIVMAYSSVDSESNVTDLASARTYLGTVGHKVKVTYNVKDAAGNNATEVSAIFTAVANPVVPITPEPTTPVITPTPPVVTTIPPVLTTPTPVVTTPTPVVTPTSTPEVTPTPVVTPTPEVTPTPVVTPAPEVTPTPVEILPTTEPLGPIDEVTNPPVDSVTETSTKSVTLPTENTPLGLPKTGGIPDYVFYGLGAGTIVLGIALRKYIK